MATKQSKQEKRLAKGLAKQATKDAAQGVITIPSSQVEIVPEAEVVQELPELQPEQPAPEAPAPEAPKPAAKGPVLHVKKGLTLRGGRGEWYKLLCKYDGQPVAAYVAEGKANPASHYTSRSTKCGQPKTPESRLSWFKRAGIVTITE